MVNDKTVTISISISLDELEKIQKNWIREVILENQSDPSLQDEILHTRKECAAKLRISLPTLGEYTKLGLIKSYRIGSRIRYKQADIEKALNEIHHLKNRRERIWRPSR